MALIWALNSSLLAPTGETRILAHRGVHQTHSTAPRDGSACTAQFMDAPTHGFIENTIPSMQAAVAAGAQVIELDVHLPPDNVFAVFHDWTLDCRTNGQGVTEKTPFDTLRGLDIGHGYTADGSTYPLRGQGIGLMPSLRAVLVADLGAQYLVNFKSKRADEGLVLAKMLETPAYARQIWGVYGGSVPTHTAINAALDLRGTIAHR